MAVDTEAKRRAAYMFPGVTLFAAGDGAIDTNDRRTFLSLFPGELIFKGIVGIVTRKIKFKRSVS